MATNAPYFQRRADQVLAGINRSTDATHPDAAQSADLEFIPVTTIKQSIDSQHLPLHTGQSTRQLPGVDGQHTDIEESHNLVELLEAATTAADQDPVATPAGKITSAAPASESKNKRAFGPRTGRATSLQNSEGPAPKRCRIDTSSTDPNLDSHNVDTAMRSPASKKSPSPSQDNIPIDARAAGVHSAAALFRRSTSNSTRKYTRPPMSKLFMSLNITPENFITLQSLAKAYMLSPAHPERQSCVGNRGKGDNDMVKLRLFNCVRDFLTDDGVGERFFGEHVEKPGERESLEAAAALGEEGGGEKLVWPRDGNKIVGLVTPLMRRMVTNERQRLYAIDSRKGGKKGESESSVEAHAHPSSPAPNVEQDLQTTLDPTLQRSAAIQVSSPSTPSATTVQTDTLNATLPSTSSPALLTAPKTPPASFSTDAAEPHLTNINIFVTYAPNASRGVKLDEKRISTARPAHLTFYNYTAFLEQVSSMIARAELLHPSVRSSNNSSNTAAAQSHSNDSESLRGLAAAANALQPDKDDQQQPQSIPSVSPSARYVVKTVGPTGWQVIDSAERWYHVLTERAFATWADGVCNIIVELGGSASIRSGARAHGALEGIDEVQMADV